MLLKSTTRHIHLYAAEVQGNELKPSDTVLTMDIDPDQEFNWSEEALQQVQRQFDTLVESYNGQDLSEYNLRRIGSELEHFVRELLGKGVISYNLQARALNYSMGLPRMETDQGQGLFVK
ncbi:MAG: NAD(P)H-quinone oxidoreductase subunit M [Cyanobacteria bacterium P01_G01_bin.54]